MELGPELSSFRRDILEGTFEPPQAILRREVVACGALLIWHGLQILRDARCESAEGDPADDADRSHDADRDQYLIDAAHHLRDRG